MKGVKTLLRKGGIFASENQYWLAMVQQGHYDNVFHQHLRNYSLRPLIRLFSEYGMDVSMSSVRKYMVDRFEYLVVIVAIMRLDNVFTTSLRWRTPNAFMTLAQMNGSLPVPGVMSQNYGHWQQAHQIFSFWAVYPMTN